MFKEDAMSALAGFHAGPLSWLIGIGNVGFQEGGIQNWSDQRKTLIVKREPTAN